MAEARSMEYIIRLVNDNFGSNDIWATLTYKKEEAPASEEQAKANMDDFILRLEEWMQEKKVKGILSYMHATHFNGEKSYHHIITNFQDREALEGLWSGGGRTSTRRLMSNEYDREGLVRYTLRRGAGEIQLHETAESALRESQSRIPRLGFPDSEMGCKP